MIGSLGDVEFEVSYEKVRTFNDLQVQRSAKFAEHNIHGRKALLEFTGFSPASLSLKVKISAALGIEPLEELNALREILNKHEAIPFILDGEPQGDGLWVLEGLDENYEIINNQGKFIEAEVSLKLKEYIEIEDEEGG